MVRVEWLSLQCPFRCELAMLSCENKPKITRVKLQHFCSARNNIMTNASGL